MTESPVREGVLVKPRYFSVPGLDVSGVRIKRGDFDTQGLAIAADKPSVLGSAIREYRKHSLGRRAVAFCVTVDHAQHVSDTFAADGIRSAVVSGETPKSMRDAILSDLRAGRLDVVSTVMVLTEGWDLPALECLICLRPTKSLNLWLQMLGRVMRTADGKSGAVVLDHAGNIDRHGLATDPVDFDLDGWSEAKKPGSMRTCPKCFAVFPSAEGWPCPECGYAPPEKPKNQTGGLNGSEVLVEVVSNDRQSNRVDHVMWSDLRSRMSISAARHVYATRKGEWPTVSDDGRILDPESPEGRKVEYFRLLDVAISKGYKVGFAAVRYQKRFGKWPGSQWKAEYESKRGVRS